MGLRNPFTIGVSQRTGQLMINDVGEFYFEEVNLGRPGANYGWPMMEGPETREGEEQAAPPDSITSPFYHYEHAAQANSGNLAVVGAAFYEPTTASAPQEYDGEYFFADFGNGWIRRLDLATHAVGEFASGLREGIVDLDMDAQARIYYTIFYGGSVHMIGYAPSQSPSIAQPLADQTAAVGRIATFLVSPWGSAPFEYQWQRDGVDIPGANAASLDIVSDDALDGARFRVVVRNAFGETVSREAILLASHDQPPTAVIELPRTGSRVRPGQVLRFRGDASDVETPGGRLPNSAFNWRIDLLHNDHVHPGTHAVRGKRAGSLRVPRHDEPGRFGIRVQLTVTDTSGQVTTVARDVWTRHA